MQNEYLLPSARENEAPETLSLAEILSSLSYALDLTSGQVPGHTERACLIGMRLAAALGLDEATMNSLYHALLMKDAGCSSNAARMFEIYGGDDIRANHAAKVVDWSRIVEAVKYAAAHALPESGLLARARRMLKIAGMGGITDKIMESRCSRGAEIALSLGLGAEAAECIRYLDEHWDGQGAPYHLRGEQIPILARVACLAQTLEVFSTTFGPEPAYEMLHARAGRWFDPTLVHVADSFRRDDAFWYSVRESPHATLLGLDIEAAAQPATEERLDAVCSAFAQIVDAKSHFTGEHSSRVCEVSLEIADGLGITGQRRTTLRRAALLHDIGKLAVPNTILDKNGKPTEDEWACIRRHPYYTQQVLSQITGFERRPRSPPPTTNGWTAEATSRAWAPTTWTWTCASSPSPTSSTPSPPSVPTGAPCRPPRSSPSWTGRLWTGTASLSSEASTAVSLMPHVRFSPWRPDLCLISVRFQVHCLRHDTNNFHPEHRSPHRPAREPEERLRHLQPCFGQERP